jgi:predicted nucleotide-binding protein
VGSREDYEDAIQRLRDVFVSRATGGSFDESTYRTLRGYVLSVPELSHRAPEILRDIRSASAWWAFIKPKFGTYWERTRWIDEQFEALFSYVETLPREATTPAGGASLDHSRTALEQLAVTSQLEHRPPLPMQSASGVRADAVEANRRALPRLDDPARDASPDSRVAAEHVRVFVVHGHDTAKRDAVARYVEKLGFDAVVLGEQPNAGRTIIEKFEDYSKVAFAIVLMTPDDRGSAKGAKAGPRARQNVILELGFFIGALGRTRVAALVVGPLEKPSDVDGVLYTPWDERDAWKMAIAREMRAAGLPVDMNKV